MKSYADAHNKIVDAFVSQKYNDFPLPGWAAGYYEVLFFSLSVTLATSIQKGIDGVKLLRWVRSVPGFSDGSV